MADERAVLGFECHGHDGWDLHPPLEFHWVSIPLPELVER